METPSHDFQFRFRLTGPEFKHRKCEYRNPPSVGTKSRFGDQLLHGNGAVNK